MALVTVQRNSSVANSTANLDTAIQEKNGQRNCSKSLNECYFAGKSAAVVLPTLSPQTTRPLRVGSSPSHVQLSTLHPQGSGDIQQHLQSMCYLLRPEDTLKMAVKLESAHIGRTRYLVVVSHAEQSCLLGIDCGVRSTVGLVLRVLADATITLDGDGGFKVSVCDSQHTFKPVSVQAMWSALQTLHRVSAKAREKNFYSGGLSHRWVAHYEARVQSERSCLNEWHAMDSLESRRPPSPDSLRNKPSERAETERIIRSKLKEIMMSVDLDEVTSKHIRTRLEDDLDTDLGEYKPFIDQEMLVILGQMDAPTEVFENVYLGSEWNASNLEELQKNGIRNILNVTREIDNFFPGMFDYLNVRVYDDDKTDLLKHWDDTYKYISRASRTGSKVLVHCKMGISRSASVIVAYAMKAYDWDLSRALKHVKAKRNCIKPNTNFVTQLETYQGILDAMKNREKLQRSKSETNLEKKVLLIGGEPTPLVQALERHRNDQRARATIPHVLTSRPKSWSPDDLAEDSRTLESSSLSLEDVRESKNIIIPCNNGNVYSVSQNRIVHLENNEHTESSKVRNIVCELESQTRVTTEQEMWDPGPNLIEKSCNLYNRNRDEFVEILSQKENYNYDVKRDPGSEKREKLELKKSEKHSPSRQNSWSSFDSAVGVSIRNTPSRHSSWGSGDNRTSRNSSLGSYDVPCYTCNVKRTRFKLEYGRDDVNSVVMNYPKPYRNPFGTIQDTIKDCSRLSSSAPEVSSMPVLGEGVLLRSKSIPSTASRSCYEGPKPYGLVRNLKLEFESKTASKNLIGKQSDDDDSRNKTKEDVEDLSVKLLVGKYENTKPDTTTSRSMFEIKQKVNKVATLPIFISGDKLVERSYRRPPIITKTNTNSLVANVIAKAANKKQLQHGKTHPLTRLTGLSKSRHSNNTTAYNTM